VLKINREFQVRKLINRGQCFIKSSNLYLRTQNWHVFLQFSLIHVWFPFCLHSALPAPATTLLEQFVGYKSLQIPYFSLILSDAGQGICLGQSITRRCSPSHMWGLAVVEVTSMQYLLSSRFDSPHVFCVTRGGNIYTRRAKISCLRTFWKRSLV